MIRNHPVAFAYTLALIGWALLAVQARPDEPVRQAAGESVAVTPVAGY